MTSCGDGFYAAESSRFDSIHLDAASSYNLLDSEGGFHTGAEKQVCKHIVQCIRALQVKTWWISMAQACKTCYYKPGSTRRQDKSCQMIGYRSGQDGPLPDSVRMVRKFTRRLY